MLADGDVFASGQGVIRQRQPALPSIRGALP